MNKEFTIIGAGNMGQSFAEGLLQRKLARQEQLTLTNSKTKNNKEAAAKAEVIIFAVKPQVMKEALQEVGEVKKESLVLSVAAGVTRNSIAKGLSSMSEAKIVRVMPNLGARVGESMSVWVANPQVTADDRKTAREVLGAIGKECEVESDDFVDKATAIAGSGPAYFYYIVELLTEMGKQFGFSDEKARLLAEQTFIGAAKVLAASEQDAATLRRAVTSKGGTTEAAFRQFQKDRFGKRFMRGVERAYKRAKELSMLY